MNWFYAKNGSQQGPLSTEDLKSRVAMGEVGPNDLAWREGMSDWMPVGQISELKVATAATVSQEPASGPSMASSPASPYQSPASAPSSVQLPPGQQIPSYLWQSIVVTILCCWPLGIPAIVFAAKVEGLKARGDFAAAKEASDNAKKWSIISLVLGLVVILIYIALAATGVLTQGLQAQ
jgi:hypothetical protein